MMDWSDIPGGEHLAKLEEWCDREDTNMEDALLSEAYVHARLNLFQIANQWSMLKRKETDGLISKPIMVPQGRIKA